MSANAADLNLTSILVTGTLFSISASCGRLSQHGAGSWKHACISNDRLGLAARAIDITSTHPSILVYERSSNNKTDQLITATVATRQMTFTPTADDVSESGRVVWGARLVGLQTSVDLEQASQAKKEAHDT